MSNAQFVRRRRLWVTRVWACLLVPVPVWAQASKVERPAPCGQVNMPSV